ncbi:ABC transporter permease [Salinisphaera orenii]|uniref:ABC transporter permease n=1 Tax=Salinisphaera orenii TaxID=856731 RepID=UPI0019550AAC
MLIAQQVVTVGTLAIGQALIILVAGIDLANGVVMVLSTVVMASLATSGVPIPLAVLCGFAVVLCIGVFEAGTVAGLGLTPFIITLGLFTATRAGAQIWAGGAPVTGVPSGLLVLGDTWYIAGAAVPIGPLVMIGVLLVTWYALSQTAWGRHVYAVGNDPAAARLSGVRVKWVLASVYLAASIIYGITALLFLGRTTVADPSAGLMFNLESITAVVIGGISLFGGRGSVIGALVGALIVGVLRNGLTIVGIDALYQHIAVGLLVILAVGLDRVRTRERG